MQWETLGVLGTFNLKILRHIGNNPTDDHGGSRCPTHQVAYGQAHFIIYDPVHLIESSETRPRIFWMCVASWSNLYLSARALLTHYWWWCPAAIRFFSTPFIQGRECCLLLLDAPYLLSLWSSLPGDEQGQWLEDHHYYRNVGVVGVVVDAGGEGVYSDNLRGGFSFLGRVLGWYLCCRQLLFK